MSKYTFPEYEVTEELPVRRACYRITDLALEDIILTKVTIPSLQLRVQLPGVMTKPSYIMCSVVPLFPLLAFLTNHSFWLSMPDEVFSYRSVNYIASLYLERKFGKRLITYIVEPEKTSYKYTDLKKERTALLTIEGIVTYVPERDTRRNPSTDMADPVLELATIS
ncbi:MAG: hypothetical protein V1743_00900 [Nanoarchaeota archaeon]